MSLPTAPCLRIPLLLGVMLTLLAHDAQARSKKKSASTDATTTTTPAPAAAPVAAPKPPPPPPKPERKRVMVLDVEAKGVDPKGLPPIAELIAWEIARHKGYDVASADDVRRFVSLETEKQTLGCGQDDACLIAMSRKVEAELVVHGSIGLVGTKYILSLSLINAKEVGKASGAVETVDILQDVPKAVPLCLARLFKWEAGTATAFKLPHGKKQSFAVLDLKPTGLSPDVVQNLTQILSVEVKGIEGATVISREDITAMLQLSATKMSLGCADDACISEIGGALGVDWLITGDAGKLGTMFIVNLRLIDVRHATVENRVTESYQGDEEQLLRAVRHAVRDLLALPQTGAGRLAITANQNAAKVYVDEQERGEAPIPIESLSIGRHDVRVSRPGYFDWRSDIYVDRAETTSVWAQLGARPQAWYQKWWVWTIAGAVVAGATTTSVILTRPSPTVGHGTVTFP